MRRKHCNIRQFPLILTLLLALVALGNGCSGGSEDDSSDSNDTAASTKSGGDDAKAGKGKKKGKDGKDEEETPVPVEVVSLKRGEIESLLHATATLEAEERVEVHSQAARLIREILVEEGDQVERGELLLRLQDDEQRSEVAKARHQFDKAARELERQRRLYEKEMTSEEAFNNATYELESARLVLEDAEREFGYTRVTAPIKGTITSRLVSVGDQITAGQHLFDLIDFDSIVARIYVPEKELSRLEIGQPVRLRAQSTGDRVHEGTVKRISPVVDPKSGTVKVTVGIRRNRQLRPGMYVNVSLVTDVHSDAVLVPKRALVYDKDQLFVYRMGDEKRVKRLLLEPVLSNSEFVEPRDGFQPGDLVVVAGQAGLKDKSLVRVPEAYRDATAEAESGAPEEDDAAERDAQDADQNTSNESQIAQSEAVVGS